MENQLPTVGLRGHYLLSEPFSTPHPGRVIFTCRSVRSFSEAISQDVNILARVYRRYGLSSVEYYRDFQNGVYLAELQTDNDVWITVPTSYIIAYPVINGVVYHSLVLGVNVGTIPIDLDTEFLKDMVKDVVFDYTGMAPSIKDIQVSQTIIVPHDEHTVIETARLERVRQTMTSSARARMLALQLDRANAKIAELEKYIKDNHT